MILCHLVVHGGAGTLASVGGVALPSTPPAPVSGEPAQGEELPTLEHNTDAADAPTDRPGKTARRYYSNFLP